MGNLAPLGSSLLKWAAHMANLVRWYVIALGAMCRAFRCVTPEQEAAAAAQCATGTVRLPINDGPILPRSMSRPKRPFECHVPFIDLGENERCKWLENVPRRIQNVILRQPDRPINTGLRRFMESLEMMIADIVENDVRGDVMQTGVYIGVVDALIAAILKAHDKSHRTHWLCDSFTGMPPPSAKYPQDAKNKYFRNRRFDIGVGVPRRNFEELGLLDDEHQEWVVGYFNETMPSLRNRVESLSLLRLDADLYQPTWEVLVAMYDRISIGGYVVLDDMHLPYFTRAVTDFRMLFNITEPVYTVQNRQKSKNAGGGSWWRKERQVKVPTALVRETFGAPASR